MSSGRRLLTGVAHAAGEALGLAVGDALALVALTALEAACPVLHGGRAGTLARGPGAPGLLLAGRILGIPALDPWRHERAVLAAGRVLVAAGGPLLLAQLAVLVAAGVVVLGPQEPGVALLVAFDPQVTAERLLRLAEAPARLGLQDVADRAQAARREPLVVHVVAAHTVRVHEVRATLARARAALLNQPAISRQLF